LQLLLALASELRARHLATLVGTDQAVLCEGPGKTGYSGRSEQAEIVHFGAQRDLSGELVNVRIVEAFKNSLLGELVDPTLRAPLCAAKRKLELPVVAS
jgi:tRNA A37 methylthiotransferase MiaB